MSGGTPTFITAGRKLKTGPGSDGALGCFAHANGDPTKRLLLSCAHVLFGDALGQRQIGVYPEHGSSCCRPQQTGTTRDDYYGGFHQASVRLHRPGPPPSVEIVTGFDTDAAVAEVNPAVSFRNELPGGIGPIQGVPSAGFGVTVGPPFGTLPAPTDYVRVYSPEAGAVRWGTVLGWSSLGLSPEYADGGSGPVPPLLHPLPLTHANDRKKDSRPNINMMIILPRPPPPAGPTTVAEHYAGYPASGASGLWFGGNGDSGSVVVNHANQVIGLLVRAGPMPQLMGTEPERRAVRTFGTVSPIGPVLKQLQITIPAGGWSSTGPSAGSPTVLRRAEEEAALTRGIERLRDAIGADAEGAALLAAFDRQLPEAQRLVTTVRRVTLIWHQGQGPAFLQHAFEHLRDPEHRIPHRVNGVTGPQLVDRMAEVLAAHGSAELQAAIARHHGAIRDRLAAAPVEPVR